MVPLKVSLKNVTPYPNTAVANEGVNFTEGSSILKGIFVTSDALWLLY